MFVIMNNKILMTPGSRADVQDELNTCPTLVITMSLATFGLTSTLRDPPSVLIVDLLFITINR